MRFKVLVFILGYTVVYKTDQVASCQPPPLGFNNNYGNYYRPAAASQQYSYQQRQQPSPQQFYQPPVQQPENVLHQTSGVSSPTLAPSSSFLQDNSVDENNPFFQEQQSQNSVLLRSRNGVTPPPDPPANPFGDSRPKPELEATLEQLAKFAEQCMINGAQDLEGFRTCTESYSYSLTATHAQFGSNKCDFEPEFVCRFYSAPHETFSFKTGQFRVHPKANRVFEETFAILTKRPVGNEPDQTFIFLDVPFAVNENSAGILKTDITCQNKDGKLSFDYWGSDPGIVLKVCTRTEKERSCTQDINYESESSRVEVDVIKPSGDKFSVEIIVSNFGNPAIFLIDNLDYEAEMCEDASFAVDNNAFEDSNKKVPDQKNIAFGSRLENLIPIQKQNFQLFQPSQYPQAPAYSRQKITPNPDFNSAAGYVTAPPPFFQTSTVIPPNPFGPVKSMILFKRKETEEFNHSYSIPVGKSEASKITDGIAFVQNKYTQAPKKGVVSKGIKKLSSGNCEVLKCSFENDFCHYSQPKISASNVRYGTWQISRTKIGNPGTGIKVDEDRQHSGFAFVGMDQNTVKVTGRTVYVLESDNFELEADTLLSFDLYRRSNAITLQVCLDSLMNCPYEAPALRSTTYWREGESVIMPKATKKIFFVATQWKRFKWLAIDNITVNKDRGCHGLTVSKRRPFFV